MDATNELPWLDIHAFMLDCGNMRSPKEFSVQIVKKLFTLVPYDQARIYYVNDNGLIYDEYLSGVDKQWTRLYHEYYSHIENGRYSIFANITNKGRFFIPKIENSVHDWTNHERNEFLTDYIRPQGLQYSVGFGLHDIYNTLKISLTFDRTSYGKFTDKELSILNLVRFQLDNLHRNFYVKVPDELSSNLKNDSKLLQLLTTRETEIMNLLSKGVTPVNISKKLCISQTTVYKHIDHIYKKLNVSSLQELLVELFISDYYQPIGEEVI